MARPNARAGNPPHSRRAGDGPPYCSIPSRTAPPKRAPTRWLAYGRVSLPSSHSHPHCPSTSSAKGRATWGSRWHNPTHDQATLRIADELETRCRTARSRRAPRLRNVPQPHVCHDAGLASHTRAQPHTAQLLPLMPAPWLGEVDGTAQR